MAKVETQEIIYLEDIEIHKQIDKLKKRGNMPRKITKGLATGAVVEAAAGLAFGVLPLYFAGLGSSIAMLAPLAYTLYCDIKIKSLEDKLIIPIAEEKEPAERDYRGIFEERIEHDFVDIIEVEYEKVEGLGM